MKISPICQYYIISKLANPVKCKPCLSYGHMVSHYVNLAGPGENSS